MQIFKDQNSDHLEKVKKHDNILLLAISMLELARTVMYPTHQW